MSKKHNYRVITAEQVKPRNYVCFERLALDGWTLEQACAYAAALSLGIVKEDLFCFRKAEDDSNLALEGYGILRETRK